MNKLTFILLYPFSCVFNVITLFRNFLFDTKIKKSFISNTFTINIGNVRVGGTGKTPHVEWFIRHFLDQKLKVATLNRGYGRKTKGFMQANVSSDSASVGDEALQYFSKFGKEISVFVGERRAEAVQKIETIFSPDVIMLDDAFQHRAFQADFSVVLTEFNRPFFKDFLLPAGRLREARNGIRRADALIVTKCSDSLTERELMNFCQEVRKYSSVPVFFSRFIYGQMLPFFSNQKFCLVAGIDNPKPFIEHCRKLYAIEKELIFPDHHDFSERDIELFTQMNCPILTTEKDFMRLKIYQNHFSIFYIPIEVEFINNENNFIELFTDKYKKKSLGQ